MRVSEQLEHPLERLAHLFGTSMRHWIVIGIRELGAEIAELDEPGNDLLLHFRVELHQSSSSSGGTFGQGRLITRR